MWIVAYDQGFYPFINRYKSYAEAKKAYEELKECLYGDDCLYIAKVEELEEKNFSYIPDQWL